MENKLKKNIQTLLISALIILFIISSALNSYEPVIAKENTINQTITESGGVIIETEKVEGSLALLPILIGSVHIGNGMLYGLTITKKLERGEGQEPLIIRITSDGPISVKNLNAETIGNSIPEFEGLCTPSKFGWLCMEKVKMTVSEQSASDISLPSAKVEVCLESQCGSLPKESTMNKVEMEALLKELEDKSQSLSKAEKGLEEDKKQITSVKESISKATNALEVLNKEDNPTRLNELIETIINLLNEVYEEGADNTDNNQQQVNNLTGQLSDDFEDYANKTGAFSDLVNSASKITEELVASIKRKADLLESMEAEKRKKEKSMHQAELYRTLLKQTEDSSSKESDNGKSETQGIKEIDPAQLKKKIDELLKMIEPIKTSLDKLKEQRDLIAKERELISKQINNIKEKIEKPGENSTEEISPES